MDARKALREIVGGRTLTEQEAHALFDQIMSGSVLEPLLGAILGALATRGESIDELAGAARAMRAKVTPIAVPAGVNAIDTCGTGGDGKPTFNVSSAVAIVAAAAGATVAKHGNRSAARPSGSAEGLAALGINVDADPLTLERCLRECRVAFLYAVKLHPAMKYAGPVRQAVGIRTIFNLVGPLTNPAGVRRQLMGVSRPEHVEMIINALKLLGAERAMVVHGLEGLCDLSIAGPTMLARLDKGAVTTEQVDCSVIGATPTQLDRIFVDSPAASAAIIEAIVSGQPGPGRQTVVFNAAAALWVAGLADDWASGAAKAREALDSGDAERTLTNWRKVSYGQ